MQTTENVPSDVRVLELRPWLDLASYLVGFDLVSLSLGPGGELYALAVTALANYRETASSGVSFLRVWTERPHNVRVLLFDGINVTQRDLLDQHWNFSHVHPLPDDELLFVVSRSRCFAADVYDLNAKVFTEDGTFKREFLLGDGIRDMQTTTDGRIWTSYFDEGIFGNFGWREPIGKSGLSVWDRFGNRLFAYSPPPELGVFGKISDCYALNVVSGTEAWCYYMDMTPAGGFSLIYLRHERITATWESPISGAHGIALWHDHILFCGRFRQQEEFNLFVLSDDGQMRHQLRFNIVDEQGAVLSARRAEVRGSMLVLRQDFRCYRLDIRDLIDSAVPIAFR